MERHFKSCLLCQVVKLDAEVNLACGDGNSIRGINRHAVYESESNAGKLNGVAGGEVDLGDLRQIQYASMRGRHDRLIRDSINGYNRRIISSKNLIG